MAKNVRLTWNDGAVETRTVSREEMRTLFRSVGKGR